MSQFKISMNYCLLWDNLKSEILEIAKTVIEGGQIVLFNEKNFTDFEVVNQYLKEYCNNLPQREEEVIATIKKWKADHPDLFR